MELVAHHVEHLVAETGLAVIAVADVFGDRLTDRSSIPFGGKSPKGF